jgi:hypothetical protein
MSETEPETGWRVLDPDGNVVASGPVTELEMAALMGEATGPEGSDGGD